MMQTSYLAKVREMSEENKSRCVSICHIKSGLPAAEEFLPSRDVLNRFKASLGTDRDIREYVYSFLDENLSVLNPYDILERYEDKIIVCCDGLDKFCHRRVIALWLEYHTGYLPTEWEAEPSRQMELKIQKYIWRYYHGK